ERVIALFGDAGEAVLHAFSGSLPPGPYSRVDLVDRCKVPDLHFRLEPDTEWYRTALGVQRWTDTANTITSRSGPTNGTHAVADPRSGYTGEYQQIGVRRWEEPTGVVSGQMQVGGGPHAVADPRYEAFGEHYGKMRVERFDEPAHVVTGSDRVGSGALSIADPRPQLDADRGALGVIKFDETAGTIIGVRAPGQGKYSVADPRLSDKPRFSSVYRIVPWDETGKAITGNGGPAMGVAVADPRTSFGPATHNNILHVTPFNGSSKTISCGDHPSGGALCVADPRPLYARDGKDVYKTSGEYGVVPFDASSGAVTAHAGHDNGRWSVADPRECVGQAFSPALPKANDRLVAVIRALDGTYHRPFTTLELAALQSLVDADEILELYGSSDSAWRERIGNAVPPDAAEAIASVMAQTLLLAWAGETFQLSATPVWVRPVAIAISVKSEAF